jgi:hypothetical protein
LEVAVCGSREAGWSVCVVGEPGVWVDWRWREGQVNLNKLKLNLNESLAASFLGSLLLIGSVCRKLPGFVLLTLEMKVEQ